MTSQQMYSETAENVVIATLMQHPEFYFHFSDLKYTHFMEKHNQILYWTLCSLVKENITVDAVNIATKANSTERTFHKDVAIAEADIIELFEDSYDVARTTVDEYKIPAKTVKDWSFKRQMLDKLRKCVNYCYKYDGDDIYADIQREIQTTLDEYSGIRQPRMLGDIIDDIWDEVENAKEGVDFVDFHIDALNDFCQLERKETVVVAADAKVGKSMFCMNESVNLANKDKVVLYIDTEISDKQFSLRLLSYLSQIDFNKLKKNDLTDKERVKVAKWRQWIKRHNIAHEYVPYIDKTELITLVSSYRIKYDIDAVIFDYVKGSGSEDDAYTKSQKLGDIVDTLKNSIAGEMDLITMCAAQATENDNIADSKKIIRNCSTLLIVGHKDGKQLAQDGGKTYGTSFIKIKANRNGKQLMDGEYISIDFDGDKCTFKDCKQQPVKQYPY